MGLVVCMAVLLIGYFSRGLLIVSLIASLAFGSTAFATLTSLGGSTPLIYTFFAALLVTAVAARRRIWQELGSVFGSVRPIWMLACLMLYAIVGAWLLPRLFAGQISVFVQTKTRKGVVESVLEPVSANTTQTAYFILGGLTAIALCVLLQRGDRLKHVRRGFFVWCCLHTGLGLVDFIGKLAGAGDVLAPIRTAGYAMLTGDSQAGFSRIAGAYSEASTFGAASLACLAFTYTYWRKTKSVLAQWLTVTVFLLIVLSTSSTAYVGLAVISIPVAISLTRALLKRRLQADEVLILAALAVGLTIIAGISIYDEKILAPFQQLFEATIVNKSSSSSGHQRMYWNIKSLEAFSDTTGLGIGFGSSRASSWAIAVLSQLGLVGSLMMAALAVTVVRGLEPFREWADPETDAIVSSLRACALANILAASVGGGTADPGMLFFIPFAVISACKVRARRECRRHIDEEGRQSGSRNRSKGYGSWSLQTT
jgi:hypothetical protein